MAMAKKERTEKEILEESWPGCDWAKIYLFGDSLTQYCFSKDGCWGTLLADHVQRRCDVQARGFSGYNTRWCREVLPCISMEYDNVVAFTIFLGANDANNFELNPRQHVPLEEYRENLMGIVKDVMDQGIRRESIILITPPAFDAVAWGEECKKKGKVVSKDNKTTGLYAKVCREVAEEMGVPCVDLYSKMMEAEDFPSYLCDGLHLSEKGSQLLFDLLKPIIDKVISHLPVVWFPFWDEVDVNDYKKCLQDSIYQHHEKMTKQKSQ